MVQSVGLPAWSSTQIRKQEVHSNGPVLDDTILSDPEVRFAVKSDSNICLYLSSLSEFTALM